MIERIQEVLNNLSIKYNYDNEKGTIYFSVDIENSVGKVGVIIQIFADTFLVYAVLNSKTSKQKMPLAAEYLHRVNYGMINGNFELNYDNGEVRYKTFVNAKETDISAEVIQDSIMLPIIMCKKFGEGLLTVLTGNTSPENVLKTIKNTNELR